MRRILVIDVGGTHVKVGTAGRKEPLKIPSGKTMTAARMAADVRKAVADWKYDVVSIGYPGPVTRGKPALEPHNLGGGWSGIPVGAFGHGRRRSAAVASATCHPAKDRHEPVVREP